jgi:ribosomal-protein-alanine N-acetyltransferase
MKIETQDLIIRNFEQKDEKDLCEYMLQIVNTEFEAYPDFTPEKSQFVRYVMN